MEGTAESVGKRRPRWWWRVGLAALATFGMGFLAGMGSGPTLRDHHIALLDHRLFYSSGYVIILPTPGRLIRVEQVEPQFRKHLATIASIDAALAKSPDALERQTLESRRADLISQCARLNALRDNAFHEYFWGGMRNDALNEVNSCNLPELSRYGVAVVSRDLVLSGVIYQTGLPSRYDAIVISVSYFWLVAALGFAPAVFGGLRAACAALRARRNRCRECGYWLRGLSEPRCPECGTAFTIASGVESD